MGVYNPQMEKTRRMYSHVISGISEDIKIMGYPFYAEDIQAREPYNRRERKWTPIFNGTEEVTEGEYVHREYSFSSISIRFSFKICGITKLFFCLASILSFVAC